MPRAFERDGGCRNSRQENFIRSINRHIAECLASIAVHLAFEFSSADAVNRLVTTVSRFELILLLMAVVVGLELVARRIRMPPAAAFIVGGIALALIPGTPDVELDPDLALVLFLPPLLLASAYFTVWRDFRANLRIIVQLAVGAVAFTTLAVGVVAHLVEPSLPWAACFALGAIVSPPDAVAAKAVLQGLSLPSRVTVLLEGESLVNDATGLSVRGGGRHDRSF
jgi:CPA1 family monovalent cation:H+ antiporter